MSWKYLINELSLKTNYTIFYIFIKYIIENKNKKYIFDAK
jgi:hypothetical protein